MVRKSKWLDEATHSQPASEAATLALRGRLDVVAHYLPLAAENSDEDIEYVHQLRVATRRAMAATETFAPLLSERLAQKMLKRLRKIRRGGGDARDCDVLMLRIETLAEQCEDAPWDELLDWVHKRRHKAQGPLRKIAKKLPPEKLERQIETLLESVHDPLSADDRETSHNGSNVPNFRNFARCQLRQVLDKFFAVALSDLTCIETLHAFRIEAKHLRYSMELLAAAFDASFRKELYTEVSNLQQMLGDINDHATAIRTFELLQEETSRKRLMKQLQKMAKEEREALTTAREAFSKYWTADRAACLQAQLYGLTAPDVPSPK